MSRAALVAAAVLVQLASATPGTGILALYYTGSLKTAFLKANPGPGWYSPCPGTACVPFSPSTNASYPATEGWQYVEVAGNSVTWVETDNSNGYDHCAGGANCAVTAPGVYVQKNGVIQALETFPSGCPAACVAPKGSCVQPGDVCECAPGFLGADCAGSCPIGKNGSPCSGHGNCTSGAPSCSCMTGFASCGTGAGAACGTDVNSDPANCGGCGVVCGPNPGEHIVSAQCVAATCQVTCASGYQQCPGQPGVCVQGTDPSACGLPGCQTFSDNQCSGSIIITPPEFGNRTFQTPMPGAAGYMPSYQQWYRLTGYTRVVYTDTTRTAANASVVTFQKDASETLQYSWDGGNTWSSQSWTVFCSASYSGSVPCTRTSAASANATVKGSAGSTLTPDVAWFIWAAPPLTNPPGDNRGGQKGGIVELFGWPYADVAAECADLASYGWLGAKLWPVMESVASWEPFNSALNPWFFHYQPISYSLNGRGGSMAALRAAMTTCRAAGVRLYADAVTNHMVGAGNDALLTHRAGSGSSCTEWGPKTSTASFWANGTIDGSTFAATQDFQFSPNANSGEPPSQEFPRVPYSTLDFHCERALNSWTDPLDLNAGWLEGLVDLNTEVPYVQQRIADYMTDLVSFGFSGLRIDAAKHMQPADHIAILSIFRQNMGAQLPGDFIEWMEVLTGGEGDLLVANNASGYNYGGWMEQNLLAAGFSEAEMLSIKLWADYYPKQPSLDGGNVDMRRKAIQNDDADQQTAGSTSRDMGNAGCVLTVNCQDDAQHRSFEEELYTSPPGSSDPDNDYPIRMLLSSFWFNLADQAYGIPDGFSDCSLCQVNCDTCTSSMPYSPAHVAGAPGYTPNTVGAYTRTHRDPGIINAMRAWMHLPPLGETHSDMKQQQ